MASLQASFIHLQKGFSVTESNYIELLMKMHYDAKIGHLGGNLSCITALIEIMRLHPPNLARIILSKGHSAGALYVSLAHFGFIEQDELKTFHKDGTRLAGHPPANTIPEIPFATGSLGHGLSLAAGFAKSHQLRSNGIPVFCLTSDGEWQEGSTWEALIFACHHHLLDLTIIVDHNGFQGFGSTSKVASMDPLWHRLAGFPLHQIIVDGHDSESIRAALKEKTDKIKMIFLKTIKGKGVPGFEGRMESHYLPLTETQYLSTLENRKQRS